MQELHEAVEGLARAVGGNSEVIARLKTAMHALTPMQSEPDLARVLRAAAEALDPEANITATPLADAMAGLRLEAAPPAAGRRVGMVIDLHYLEVRAKQFSLKTTWDIADMERCVQERVNGTITRRLLADSETKAFSGSPMDSKSKLHSRLHTYGYRLALSPTKRSSQTGSPQGGRPRQGGTDTCVVVFLMQLAGAFEAEPVDTIVLVAGDMDFQPALEYIARHSHVHLCVIAAEDTLRREYRDWIKSGASRTSLIELDDILRDMAPHTLDLRGKGTAILGAAEELSERVVENLKLHHAERLRKKEAQKLLVVKLQHSGRGLTDAKLAALCGAVGTMGPEYRAELGELWIHHTAITDASCEPLAHLIACCPNLHEIHISNTHVSLEGIALLVRAKLEAPSAPSSERKTRRCELYINASHIPTSPQSRRVQDVGAGCVDVKFASASSAVPGPSSRNQRHSPMHKHGRRGRGRGQWGGESGRGRGAAQGEATSA